MYYEWRNAETRPEWLNEFIASEERKEGARLIDTAGMAAETPDREIAGEIWEVLMMTYAYAIIYKFRTVDGVGVLDSSCTIGIKTLRECVAVANELRQHVDWDNELKKIEGVA